MSDLDGFRGPALLNSSGVWDHTIRALLIASMDHIHLRSGNPHTPHNMSLMLLQLFTSAKCPDKGKRGPCLNRHACGGCMHASVHQSPP